MTAQPLAAAALPASLPPRRIRLGWALLVFVWALPFHILAMAVLFGAFGLPAPIVRTVAAWKEALVATVFALTVARVWSGHGPRGRVRAADVAVAGLGLLALIYFGGTGAWSGVDLALGVRALGFRDAVFFTLLYFVGRATPEIADDPRYLRALVAVGVVTSLIAILERLLVTPQLLVLLGTTRYVQDFLGLSVTTSHNVYGLPDSYWAILGDHIVQRAGSTYLSSQGFAVPFILILPAATLVLFTAQRRRGWAWAANAVLWVGLLLTITRMSTVTCLLEVFLLAVLYRRWGTVLRAALLVTLSAGLAAAVVPGFGTYLWQTLTWQSVSSVSHLRDWTEGWAYLLEHPLGVGLGAGGLSGPRFGLPAIATDSQFFMYSIDLGILGLVLFLGMIAAFLAAGVRTFQRGGTETARALGALVAVASFGVVFNGITTLVFANPFVAYSFSWLAGSAVSASDQRP